VTVAAASTRVEVVGAEVVGTVVAVGTVVTVAVVVTAATDAWHSFGRARRV
jgi:hypothetical protein